MHELAMAESIFEIVTRHSAGQRVTLVEVKVGALRQVVPSALTFSFELVTMGTPVEGAEMRLDLVAASGRCRSCLSTGPLPRFPLQCASCGGYDLEIVAGEDLMVQSIEFEEADVGSVG